jgi:hypothetical protein
MPGDALELVEAAKITGERIVASRAGPPIFFFRRRCRVANAILVEGLKNRSGAVVVALRAQLVKIGARNLPAVAHEVDEFGLRQERRKFRDQPGQLVGRIAPMSGFAVMDRSDMRREQYTPRVARACKAQIAAHTQRLDDIDSIFVLHIDIARGG